MNIFRMLSLTAREDRAIAALMRNGQAIGKSKELLYSERISKTTYDTLEKMADRNLTIIRDYLERLEKIEAMKKGG